MPHRGTFRFVLTAVCALVLAGCSGGAGPGPVADAAASNGAEAAVQPETPPIDEAARFTLEAEYQHLEKSFFQWKPMEGHSGQVAGSATFNGVAAFGSDGAFGRYDPTKPDGPDNGFSADIVSDMAMTVDFDHSTVTGAMWDFHNREGTRAGGSIQLSGKQGGTFDVDATGSGTLDWGDHQQDLYVVLDGTVWANKSGLTGALSGSSRIGSDRFGLDGRFALENDAPRN